MILNKRGEGTALGWIIGILCLGVVGALFIILNQVMNRDIIPTFDNVATNMALNLTQIHSQTNYYLVFWAYAPAMVFFIVIIWVILNAVRKNKEDMYQ